jgi:DNA-binding IclR family transcriptional regulator
MIRVIQRTGDILSAFGNETPVRSLAECGAAANLSRSSSHRLLVSLERIGLVERFGDSWRLGPRVVVLAAIRLGQLDLRREAMPLLREIGLRYRAATSFSIPDGLEMVYLERQESPEPFAPGARLGGRAAIWAGGSGKAVLSRMQPAERMRLLDADGWRQLRRRTRNEILDEVDQAARRGYAVDPGTFFDGVAGVAVAICNQYGEPIAAISAIVPPERLTGPLRSSLGHELMAVAQILERIGSGG